MPSAWMQHVKAFHTAHPDLTFKEAMKRAAATYKKGRGVIQCPSDNEEEMEMEEAKPVKNGAGRKGVKKTEGTRSSLGTPMNPRMLRIMDMSKPPRK